MAQEYHLPKHLVDAINVVLVEPGDSLNIGSVVRVMSNLGFEKLHLVNPERYDQEKVLRTARHGDYLLSSMTVHSSLEEALSPMQAVIGFTAQVGKHRPQHLFLHEWSAGFQKAPLASIALLFGPEDTGLTQEHMSHCSTLVRIPASSKNNSFNLAQAVLVVLLELARVEWHQLSSEDLDAKPVSANSYYQLDRILEEILTTTGFFRPGTPEPIPDLVKNMIRRIRPDEREMGVLLAMFSRIKAAILPKDQLR